MFRPAGPSIHPPAAAGGTDRCSQVNSTRRQNPRYRSSSTTAFASFLQVLDALSVLRFPEKVFVPLGWVTVMHSSASSSFPSMFAWRVFLQGLGPSPHCKKAD